MTNVQLFEEFWFGKKKVDNFIKQKQKNEEILNNIYNEFDLKYHEGDFKPDTWKRSGNILQNGLVVGGDKKRNDEIITDFAGISLIYDTVFDTYKISIPVKFNRDFKWGVKDLLSKEFEITNFKDTGYTVVIDFK